MAKGYHLTPEVRKLITRIYLDHPSYGPTQIHKELLNRMKETGLDKKYGSDWPGISAVGKVVREIRTRDSARSPESKSLDEPWTFASLAEYPIAPEAIPLVASIYDKCLMEGNWTEEWNLTIREALWIGRLHKIIELHKPRHLLPDVRDAVTHFIIKQREWPTELGEHPTNQELAEAWGLKGKEIPLEDIVLEWAYTYSQYEEMSEIEGEPFDSNELDFHILRDVYEYYGDRRNDFIEQIAEDYGVDANKLEALNLSIEDIKQAALRSSEPQCRIFYVPDAEMSKMAEELRELKIGGFRGNLVFLEPNKDVPDKLLHKLDKYEVEFSKEAQNER